MDFLGFQAVEEQVNSFATSGGLPVDQAKLVFCFLLSYPLAFIFSCLPNNPTLKHWVGLLIGLWFGWFTLKTQLIHSFITASVTYLMIVLIPRQRVQKAVFFFTMLYMSCSHIYRMYVDYKGWTMDFTGIQMILTIKLTTFAFDYADGLKTEEKLTSYQKQVYLKDRPSVLEFFGYVYFFAGLIAGPAINMREYLAFTDNSLFKDAPNGKMPSAIIPATLKFGQSLLLLIGIGLQMRYSFNYIRTEEFLDNPSIFYKAGYMWFAAFLQRFPYYFAWCLTEGGCILSGIGYAGWDKVKGVGRWDRANNVRVLNLELSQSFREVTEHWNIRTDCWLRHYIYERVPSNGLSLTFLTSAVWHGFYPGYYMSFMSSAIVIQVARRIRRSIRPHFMEADEKTPKSTKKLYDLASLITTSFLLNYMMTPFMLLGWEESWKAWNSVYFIGHILPAIGYVLSLVIKPPKRKVTDSKETKKTH